MGLNNIQCGFQGGGMVSELVKFKRRKEAKETLKRIDRRRENYYLIHYSCESFYDITDGRTPRITSIAIRNFSTAQTYSFSIHKTAEQKRITIGQIDDSYDELEKLMLKEFFEYIESHRSNYYLHWNMRDINYGFQAIEHRYKVLNGKPIILEDDRKIDLARLFIGLYGIRYASHGGNGRLHTLCDVNSTTAKDMLNGQQEAMAFKNKEYLKLHQSTLRKVDVMSNLLERVLDGSIKTQASWVERHGIHPKILVEIVSQHWIWSLVVIISVILSLVIVVVGLF